MWKIKNIGLALLMFLLILVMYDFVSAEEIHRIAKLDEVEGEVFVKKGGGLKDFPAYDGMSLLEGDLITTNSASSVNIVFENDQTTLGENTQVYLARLKNTDGANATVLKQLTGQTWNNVKSLLNANDTHDVETATSVMGVRGTLFSIMIDPSTDIERLTVFEGLVENILYRELYANEDGKGVTVSEQMDISLETKERIIDGTDYDDLVERLDEKIVPQIYEDVLERGNESFEENENSTYKDEDAEIFRIFNALQTEMMLENLDEMLQAIERADGEKFRGIERELEQKSKKSIEEIKRHISEKRLQQIDQYDRLLKRAQKNGISIEKLNEYIEKYGGEKAYERIQRLDEIRREMESRVEENKQTNEIDATGENNTSEVGEESHQSPVTSSIKNNNRGIDQAPTTSNKDRNSASNHEGKGVPRKHNNEINNKKEESTSKDKNENKTEQAYPKKKENIGNTYLHFDQMLETINVDSLFEGNKMPKGYQFVESGSGGPSVSKSGIVDISFNSDKTSFTLKGKTRGFTDVQLTITDEADYKEKIQFTVEVTSILPSAINIPSPYIDQLMIAYEHANENQQEDVIKISANEQMNGYMNGWMLNNSPLSPIYPSQTPVPFSCSDNAFFTKVPNELCIDVSSIESMGEMEIKPIIDTFKINADITNGDGLIQRDTIQNDHQVLVATPNPNDGSYLKTWQVTYKENNIEKTDDYRDFVVEKKADISTNTIFNKLCPSSKTCGEIDYDMPTYEMLTELSIDEALLDDEQLIEVKAVFGNSDIQVTIENDEEIPFTIEPLFSREIPPGERSFEMKADTPLKISFTEDTDIVQSFFAVTGGSNATIIEKENVDGANPLEYYVYGDFNINLSIDFIGLQKRILEYVNNKFIDKAVGTLEEYFAYNNGGNTVEYTITATPYTGYKFENFTIFYGNYIDGFDIIHKDSNTLKLDNPEHKQHLLGIYLGNSSEVSANFEKENP